MNGQNNTTLIQNIYAAFGRGDIPFILDRLAPDVVWRLDGPAIIPYAGTMVGPSQVARFFDALATTQDEHNLIIDGYVAQGDKVVALGRYTALVKATGKRLSYELAHAWTVRDGKVAHLIHFADTAHIADAYESAAAAARH